MACDLHQTIPDLSVNGHRELWQTLETEKPRLIYSILQLGLRLVPKRAEPTDVAFDFLAGAPVTFSERGRVLTGHDQGLITLNIAEADQAEKENACAIRWGRHAAPSWATSATSPGTITGTV